MLGKLINKIGFKNMRKYNTQIKACLAEEGEDEEESEFGC